MRAAHRHAGVPQAAEPRYPVPVGSAIALAGLGYLQITERVADWTSEGRPELRSLVNPCSGAKRECECQARVVGHRARGRTRSRVFGQYLKQDAGERAASDPPLREPQDPGERESRVESADAG